MNQTQIKYARERAKSIFDRRERELREKHTTEAVTLPVKAQLKAIRDGDFTVSKEAYGGRYEPSWYQFISFDAEVRGGLDTKTFNPVHKALQAEHLSLNDQLILGDSEEALRLLEAFAAA